MNRQRFTVLFFFFFFSTIQISAQSLIQMQKDYDEMKQKIASTYIDIPCLEADKKRVESFKALVYSKLSSLSSNLESTKNYKQANEKYNELMRLVKDDPEANAIKSNYFEYKEAEKLRLELVKSKDMTLNEFEAWRKKVLDKYKSLNGANFNGYKSEYNSITDVILNL